MLDELLATTGVCERSFAGSRVGVCALHGGLEQGTAEIAEEVAHRAGASFYAVVQPDDLHWHVPSHRYDPALSDGLGRHDVLSDCAFGPDGPARDRLLVATNFFGGSGIYAVDEGSGRTRRLDVRGTLNNEAIALDRDGALYVLQDDNGPRSVALRFACTGWPLAP